MILISVYDSSCPAIINFFLSSIEFEYSVLALQVINFTLLNLRLTTVSYNDKCPFLLLMHGP